MNKALFAILLIASIGKCPLLSNNLQVAQWLLSTMKIFHLLRPFLRQDYCKAVSVPMAQVITLTLKEFTS